MAAIAIVVTTGLASIQMGAPSHLPLTAKYDCTAPPALFLFATLPCTVYVNVSVCKMSSQVLIYPSLFTPWLSVCLCLYFNLLVISCDAIGMIDLLICIDLNLVDM